MLKKRSTRLRWRDAPKDYGPHKPVLSEVEGTIYNRFVRWGRLGGACQGSDDAQHRWKAGGGAFNRIFAGLAAKGGKALLSEVEGPDQLMIDATHLKVHRTAASLLKKGFFRDVSGAPRGA